MSDDARVPGLTVVHDDEDVEPEPTIMFNVSIVDPAGVNLSASVHTSPDADAETMATLLLRAARGAAYLYSHGLLDAMDESQQEHG